MKQLYSFIKNPLIAILGPTGTGKSKIAVEVAKILGGEVISCDSMQVYRQMDIGTATPTCIERQGIRHHLINILPLNEPYDANRFIRYTHSILEDLQNRQVPGIIAGGSGMYARALIYGFRLQPSDSQIQEAVLKEFEEPGGATALQQEILAEYPEISPDILKNPRRLQRAVEISRLGGDLTEHGSDKLRNPLPYFIQYILFPPLTEFEGQLRKRTREMLRSGWINEAYLLLQKGLANTPTARQALGYREIKDYLDGTISSRDELLEVLITRTRQYARRQRTWFRHQHPGSIHLPLRPGLTASQIAEGIASSYSQVINSRLYQES